MNVGIMVSSQTPEVGGGYTFEDDILQALFRLRGKSGHDFFLVGHAPERPGHLDHTGLPWMSLHQPRELRRKRRFSRLLQRLKLVRKKGKTLDYEDYPGLKKQGLDLMCYLTPMNRPIADIPYITTVWDLMHRLTPFFPELCLRGEWESRERRCREIFPRAAYILALNSCGKKQIVDLYGVAEERVRALMLPTPGFALSEGARLREEQSLAHLGVQGEYLLYPAQFWAHKNHVCLLLALRALREKHGYKPQLVFTGSDKGNRSYVEQTVDEHALRDQVIFPGFVTREELATLYRQAIALVFPSFCGPENLPPLEAFALGCPVIASAIPGHDEQLSGAALLADPTQPELWAAAIWRLRQESGLREALIAKGKERALRYTPDHYVVDVLRIMDEFAAYRRCWATVP